MRDIANDGEKFEALRKEGVKHIGKRVRELRAALAELHAEAARAGAEMEARIQELTRIDSLAVRRPIEASIARLDSAKKDAQGRAAFVQTEIDQLQSLSTSPTLLADYRRHIRGMLSNLNRQAVHDTIAALTMHKDHLAVALSPVNHTGAVSALFVLAPPAGLEPAT